MSDRKSLIRDRLGEAREALNAVLDQVGDRWSLQVYSDDLRWTAGQLLNHLVDADRGHMNQSMNYAEGKPLVPADFDIERYNAHITRKTGGKTPAQARNELAAQRLKLITWLDDLDDDKLDMIGRHATLEMMTVEAILLHSASHERQHAIELARALEASV